MTVATEAVVRRCSVKKVFLEISQNSQENTCARVWHLYFPVNFANFKNTEHLWSLLLIIQLSPLNQ